MSTFTGILQSLGLVTPGPVATPAGVLGQTVDALTGAGSDPASIAYILGALAPAAPASLVLSGSQDFPSSISLATPSATAEPGFGSVLDPIVAVLVAANVDFGAIANVIGCIEPAAAPSLILAGSQDFPDAAPTSLPGAASQREFGPGIQAAVTALTNAGVDIGLILGLLDATAPTAPPGLALAGQQDFPAVDIATDTLAPDL